MSTSPPTVSVIIPTYQRGHLVDAAVASALAQSYRDFEVIVVVDGSTDDTWARLEEFGTAVTVVRQPHRGLSAARNAGIRTARGEYLAFLDDDDRWLPDKLACQMPLILGKPDVGLVFGDVVSFDERGMHTKTYAQSFPPPPMMNEVTLFWYNYIPLLTVVARRSCVEAVGCFDETLMGAEDYDLWLRISAGWRLVRTPEVIAHYRITPNSLQHDAERMHTSVLQTKRKAYASREAIRRLPTKLLDRYFFNYYLELARGYLQRRRVADATAALTQYRKLRGDTLAALALWTELEPILGAHPDDNLPAAPRHSGE